MQIEKNAQLLVRQYIIPSKFLERKVIIDVYLPANPGKVSLELLLINDGQDLPQMQFGNLLQQLTLESKISPLVAVGIHCGPDRKNEYGTANILNYKGQGAKAALYTRFVLEELLPYLQKQKLVKPSAKKSFCGFSLGGLSALDIVWNHPQVFSKAGVFSGSLWWRTLSQDDPAFNETQHLIMHNEIRNGQFYPGLKFFFQTGTNDEIADRNNNGIIDAIDDTLQLIDELVKKGYNRETDIHYLEIKGGTHDVATWAQAFPEFLQWGWPQ